MGLCPEGAVLALGCANLILANPLAGAWVKKVASMNDEDDTGFEWFAIVLLAAAVTMAIVYLGAVA